MLTRFGKKGDGTKNVQKRIVKFKHMASHEEDGRTKVQRKLNELVFIKN